MLKMLHLDYYVLSELLIGFVRYVKHMVSSIMVNGFLIGLMGMSHE